MYPGRIDAFLEYQKERMEHTLRVNKTVEKKQKQLQRFIDKNRAGANTASQARSKAKQLERLQTVEIESDEPTAWIRAPLVEPRQGPAVRCRNLEIGYRHQENGEVVHRVASDIHLEIEHGQRTAIVGDNGQGKTTLLRTLVDSLQPLAGDIRWGHGCEIGTYAQHVYTSLPEQMTVLEYLEYNGKSGTTTQDCLAIAGALLFRDEHVNKKIRVLSGGERARVCLAGLLLGTYNILVLDEPGNHLDVQTVEALAQALLNYQGTVLFTSHDRYFMKRIASSVIEVRDGTVKNYLGDYDAYVYSVNKEVEAGERERDVAAKASQKKEASNQESRKDARRDERKRQREISNIEKTIATLDEQKKELNRQLMETTDTEEALRLHTQFTEVSDKLTAAEERWCDLN